MTDITDNERRKQNRLYYLGIGKCPRCGGKRPLANGRALCEVCKEAHDESLRETREKWRQEGLCISCGRERAPGRMQCQKCLDGQKARRDGKQYTKKRYENLLIAGMCSSCGKTWAEPGRVLCKRCQSKNKMRYAKNSRADKLKQKRQERIAAGLCPDCGKPVEGKYKRCQRCRDMQADRTRKYKIKKRLKEEAAKARRRART